jgi:AcrR family transcriptional regulator
MNNMPAKLAIRAARKIKKRDEKKRAIAQSAIEVLKHLGYANTSLRDIAANSGLSLGMLHYYFQDRSDLIIYCVGVYKDAFVQDILAALEPAKGRENVIEVFSGALASSIYEDAATHALWYDIRTQAIFDTTFRPVVDEIEEMLVDLVRTAFENAGSRAPAEIQIYYALLDGAFRHLMQNQITGTPQSLQGLVVVFRKLLTQFL